MDEQSVEEQIVDYVITDKEKHYRLAYSYVKNQDDALDIIQDSIYKAITSQYTLKNPEYIKTWFYRILVNTSLDFLRSRKKLTVANEEELCKLDIGTVDKYENIDLKRALDDLPLQYRSIIILRFFEDLKIEDIAEILKENTNTIKTRLYKALQILRIKIEE